MTTTPTWERPARPARPPRLDPVWRKAPGVLLRAPVMLASVVGAAALLGLAAASGPLFLASTEQAMRAAEIAALDPHDAGIRVQARLSPGPAAFDVVDEALRAEVGQRLPELGAPARSARSVPVTLTSASGEQARVRLATGPGEGAVDSSPGLTVPLAVADQLGLSAGDRVELSRSDHVLSATVDDISARPVEGEWPELVADLGTVLASAAEIGAVTDVTWAFPLTGEMRDLGGLTARVRSARDAIGDRRSTVGAAVAEHAEPGGRIATDSALPAAVRRTREAAAALEPPVRSLWVAATLAGLVVVTGAGGLRARRRRREHTVLATRGVTPSTQAARAAVETALPVTAGVAAGVAGAAALVAAFGPGGHVSGALPAAAGAAVAAGVAALALVAGVTAAILRGGDATEGRVAGAVTRIPWELAPLVLAGLAYTRLRLPAAAESGPGVDPLLLGFPVLALLGAVGVAVRLLAAGLPRLRRLGAGLTADRLLVVRRLAAAPAATLSLVAVAAIAIGLLASAATLAASARATAEAKAAVAVGADAAGPVPSLVAAEGVEGTTVVGRAQGRASPGEVRVDVLAVDVADFGQVAGWRRPFAEQPLEELLEPLASAQGGAVPTVVVGTLDRDPVRLTGSGFDVAVTASARADAFPGLGAERPLLVVDREVLAGVAQARGGIPLAAALSAEVWARGTAEVAARRAAEAGADPADVTTAAAAADSAALRATRWTLGYLQGVATAAGLLGAIAVALVLTERQRAREVAYALARRMGLSRRAHRRSVAGELAALLAAAVTLGAVLGVGVAALAAPAIDPQPAHPPDPLLALPWAALAATAVGSGVVCLAGAALIQHAADRTRVGEMLRAAD